MRYHRRMKRWIRRLWGKPGGDPAPDHSAPGPLPAGCLLGLSVHAANEPEGTSKLARQTWDEVTGYDDSAGQVRPWQRPWWYLKTGGRRPLSQNFLDEIGERREKGYHVSFVNKKNDPAALLDDLRAMRAHGVAPDCIGFGNEPDLGGHTTPHQLRDALVDAPAKLQEMREFIACRYISAPALASIRNAIGTYGRVYGELFGGIPDVAAKVHSYGRIRPVDIVQHNMKGRVIAAQGLAEDGLVLLEESANAFAKEGDMEPRDEIVGQQGAEFMYAMILAGAQARIPVGHFMLEHGGSPNDIAHPEFGKLRRDAVRKAVKDMRAWGNAGDLTHLALSDPKGKPINPDMLP